MISPTGSAISPRIPTVSSRPGTNFSTITSSSYLAASSMAAARSTRFFTTDRPTVDPCFDGFSRYRRHQPIRCLYSLRTEKLLRKILVHRQRAGKEPAAGVLNMRHVEQRLNGPILSLAAMKGEEHYIRF